MKKIIILLSVALAALAVSCNKVTPQDSTPDAPKGEKITITVSLSDALSKVSLTQDPADPDGAIKVAWESTDKVYVIDANNNSSEFTVASIDTEKPYIATFTGPAVTASPFNIIYGAESVEAAEAIDFSKQTQSGNASLSNLQYLALMEGVTNCQDIEFSKAWAETNGGTFKQNGAIRFRLQMPDGVTSVASVALTASSAIFGDSNSIKVSFDGNVSPADENGKSVLTAYAMLPMSDAIEVSDETLEVAVETEDHDFYTRLLPPGAVTFKPGQTNAIKLGKSGFNLEPFAGGTGVQGDPYLIANARQMMNMHDVMVDDAVICFKMIDDVNLEGIDWVPLNNSGSYSKGINFDGGDKRHTISNLTIGDNQAYPSFVGVLNGTIKNVVFYKAEINAGSKKAGVVAGYIGTKGITGSCSNVTVNESSVQGTSFIGGFAGQVANDEDSIVDCHVISSTVTQSNETQDAMMETGGFVGSCQAAATFTECSVEGITIISKTPGKAGIGGFVGRTRTATPSFNNCTVSGKITSDGNWTGGFAGYAQIGGSFNECTTSANVEVSSTGQFAGGFVGYAAAGTYTKCSASGNVSAPSNVGGFAGNIDSGSVNICSASGKVSATGNNVGGFLGNSTGGTIISSTSSGSVETNGVYAGGFVGRSAATSYSGCHYDGTSVSSLSTSANAMTGGFVGQANGVEGDSFIACYVYNASGVEVSSKFQRSGGFAGQVGSNSAHAGTYSKCYVKNVKVNCTGTNNGTFVGVQYVTIEKCWVDGGTITASGNNTGGFSGFIQYANLNDCYTTASVNANGKSSIGGLVGVTNSGISINNCYAAGTVSGTGTNVGNLIGNLVSGASVSKSISWNSVLPLAGASGGTITNCYTKDVNETGTVSSHAQELGWSSDVWDFSGDLPTLK